MDQVRVALKWLKDQHFWVLTVIASLVAVGCWYMAASELAKEFKTNQSKIDSEFSAQQNRERMPFHPNEVVNQQQRKEIEQLALEVEQVWSRRYERQRDVVLKWPAQLDKGIKENRSSDSFLRHVSNKRFGEFISDRFRDRYLNYIQKRFPDLPKIIDALEVDDSAQGGMGMGMGSRGFSGMMEGGFEPPTDENGDLIEEQEFLVLWEDQVLVKQQLAWSQRPSSLKIWVTQEDLWVYETLLRSIAATNTAAGADRYSNAAVRNIYQLQVGLQAAQDSRTQSRIFRPSSDSAGLGGEMGMGMDGEMGMGMDMGMGGEMGMDMGMGMDMEMGMGMGMGMGMDGEMGMGMGGGAGGGEADQTLLMGRYIDADQKPLPAPAPGAPLDFGQEYKRLPRPPDVEDGPAMAAEVDCRDGERSASDRGP